MKRRLYNVPRAAFIVGSNLDGETGRPKETISSPMKRSCADELISIMQIP